MNKDSLNTKVIQSYFESLAKGDFETLTQLLTEDVVWHQPGKGELSKTYYGKQELFGLFGQFMSISQNTFKIDGVKSIMANGDLVMAILKFSARKDGQSISMDGVDLMKIVEGKIKEVWLFSEDQESEDSFWTTK